MCYKRLRKFRFLSCFFLLIIANGNKAVSQSAFNANSYRILETVPSLVNVGTGERFTSLTGIGGLFEYLRSNVMNSDVTANITTDLLEDGRFSLDADSTNGYRLTIRPATASLKVIHNISDLPAAMIRLYGMKNIVFDGSYNDSGRYLRFVNTHTVPVDCQSVFVLDSSSTNIAIRNCIIESNLNLLFDNRAGILFGETGVNKEIEIRNNQIRDATGSPGTPGLIGHGVKSISNKNKLLIIAGNEIFNFSQSGIRLAPVGDSCTIDSNHFYFNALQPACPIQVAIYFDEAQAQIIKNNFIGGSAPYCGGSPWTSNNVESLAGISIVQVTGGLPITIENNTIQNIRMTNPDVASFIGISAGGNLIIRNNTVGHPTQPNSIVNTTSAGYATLSDTRGISGSGTDSVLIINNTVANISTTGVSDVGGIFAFHGKAIIKGNKIYSLTSASPLPSTFARGSVQGLYVNGVHGGYDIEDNTIYNLTVTNTIADIRASGVTIEVAPDSFSYIKRNRIYNIENLSDSGFIDGIRLGGTSTFENNQIALTNGNNVNRVTISAITDSGDSSYYYYNSIYVGGHAASGNLNSYAFRLLDGRMRRFQNNLLYNERTGGSGNHFAIAVAVNPNAIPKWTERSSNYNFFVAGDSAKIANWGFFNSPQSMISWRSVTHGDSSTFAALNTNVPSSSLFESVGTGNLNINNNDPHCWYINGKGLPVASVSGDYNDTANVRSTNISNGATDIGSDEFNTTTLPDTLIVLGRQAPGAIDSFLLNGRLVATITWGNTGSLPALGNARYYSGSWPNDLTNGANVANARTLNTWWDIPASGGAGYSYSLTLYYDSSILGRIQDMSQIILYKKNHNEDGTWQMLFPTQINTSAKTITVDGLTGFSEFTAAQGNAPLALPGSSLCSQGTTSYKSTVTAPAYTYQWQVNDGNGFVDLANNTIYSGVADSVLTITAPSSAFNRYQYRCVVNTGSGTINSSIFLLKIVNAWTGAINNDWTNPLNWSCGQVPDANTDVHIKAGLANYPVVISNVTCRSIIASPGSVINVNPGVSVQLTGK